MRFEIMNNISFCYIFVHVVIIYLNNLNKQR